jgi:hypothetical protein
MPSVMGDSLVDHRMARITVEAMLIPFGADRRQVCFSRMRSARKPVL